MLLTVIAAMEAPFRLIIARGGEALSLYARRVDAKLKTAGNPSVYYKIYDLIDTDEAKVIVEF